MMACNGCQTGEDSRHDESTQRINRQVKKHMPSSKRGESSPYSKVGLAALENSMDNAVSKETMSYVRDRG